MVIWSTAKEGMVTLVVYLSVSKRSLPLEFPRLLSQKKSISKKFFSILTSCLKNVLQLDFQEHRFLHWYKETKLSYWSCTMDAAFSVRRNHLKSLTTIWRRAAAQLEYKPTLFSTFLLREKLLPLNVTVQFTTTLSTSWWRSLSRRYPTSSSERHCSGGGGAANSYSQGDFPSTPLSTTTSPSCICTSCANSRCFFLRFLRALRQTDGTFFPGPKRRRKRSTWNRKKQEDQIKTSTVECLPSPEKH